MDTGLFYFHVSMCIKDLGVINPKHKRKTSIRSDKQHNYTLVLKHWMRLKFLIRNEKRTVQLISLILVFLSTHTG